jgi:hypothetical protein
VNLFLPTRSDCVSVDVLWTDPIGCAVVPSINMFDCVCVPSSSLIDGAGVPWTDHTFPASESSIGLEKVSF